MFQSLVAVLWFDILLRTVVDTLAVNCNSICSLARRLLYLGICHVLMCFLT